MKLLSVLAIMLLGSLDGYSQWSNISKLFSKTKKTPSITVERSVWKATELNKVPNTYPFTSNKPSVEVRLPYSKELERIDADFSSGTISQYEAENRRRAAYLRNITWNERSSDLHTPGTPNRLNPSPFKRRNPSLSKLRYSANRKGAAKVNEKSLVNIKNAQVFISIPSTDKEFSNIFAEYNYRQALHSRLLRTQLVSKSSKNVGFPESANEFTQGLKTKNKNLPLILIGHNQDGKIYFADGTFLSIDAIDIAAKQADRHIIYLSCNAADYSLNPAVKFALTYVEAILLANMLDKIVTQLSSRNHRMNSLEIQKVLDAFGKKQSLIYNLKVAGAMSGAIGAGYGVYDVQSTKKKA